MMILYMPSYYGEVIGPKAGILLNDPVLNFFTPMDWSSAVFAILTIAIVQTFAMYFMSPYVVLTAMTTYCIINIIRMITMYLFTLEPPADMILLQDPVSAFLAYPDSTFAKDLFFSGHVSTMMALVFVEKDWRWKTLKVVGTALMGLFLAWQHVHYTVDLVAAPVITYLAYILARRMVLGITSRYLGGD